MPSDPYQRFAMEDRILRDELAIDRTVLANERTLLAYLRSGVALVLAGVTFLHFAEDTLIRVVGIACVPSGFLAIGIGVWRYRMMDRRIQSARIAEATRSDVQGSDVQSSEVQGRGIAAAQNSAPDRASH
jgi:putative membrane protein